MSLFVSIWVALFVVIMAVLVAALVSTLAQARRTAKALQILADNMSHDAARFGDFTQPVARLSSSMSGAKGKGALVGAGMVSRLVRSHGSKVRNGREQVS